MGGPERSFLHSKKAGAVKRLPFQARCLLILALLVGHGAGSLAGGLARGLALAAAALGGALLQSSSVESLNVLHVVSPPENSVAYG